MTEAQKTEAAILKAKADKITSPRIEKKVAKAEEVKISDVKKVAQETQTKQVDIKKYPFNVKLGKNKEVNFKPWTGKTKKKFTKLFTGVTDLNDVDLNQVVKVLILDNLSEDDIYLSEAEQQYIMALLRRESIDDKFEFEDYCEHCTALQKIKTTITESGKYVKNNFPVEIDSIIFKDIKSQKELDKITKDILEADDYDGLTTKRDIETALCIDFKENLNVLQTLDRIDDLDLKTLTKVLDDFRDSSSSIETSVTKECTECNKESKFTTSEIPGLYETLMS